MSRLREPVRTSSRSHPEQMSVCGPNAEGFAPHSGTTQRPSAPTRTTVGGGRGRRKTPWPRIAMSTANRTTVGTATSMADAPRSACRPTHQTHINREGLGSSRSAGSNALEEGGDVGVGGRTTTQKVIVENGVGQLENSLECGDFRLAEPSRVRIEEAEQDGIELAHPTPCSPPEPREPSVHGGDAAERAYRDVLAAFPEDAERALGA